MTPFFKTSIFMMIAVLALACSKNRQVVPVDIDADEVFKALTPNDEDFPDRLSFGENHIPGFTFDYEMTTDNADIYVFFQNLTILDVKAEINQSIFEFIQQQLADFGFVNDSLSLPPDEFANLISSRLSFAEAGAKILDMQKEAFENQVNTISSYKTPFNISFQIYPVFLDQNYVTFRELAYAYTGGAHGISISHLVTFDLNSGKRLSLDNIVSPQGMETVREEVVAQMAYSYPIYENITTVDQYIDSLNSWVGDSYGDEASEHDNRITIRNYPLPDPALTKEGLAFIYQMYILTPGSDGCPLVVIPYKDIRGCLLLKDF